MVVNGKRREVRPRAERVSRLRKAISVITAGMPISGHQLEIIIGYIVSRVLIQRYSLSALDLCCKLVQASQWTRTRVWNSVISKL